MKKFRDLKKGDSVWIVNKGEVVEAKVKETRENCYYGQFYVYTSFHDWPYCGFPGSRRAGNLFIDEEDAFRQLEKISRARMKILEKKIETLVTEFDLLDSISPPTEFSSTKPPSMKELKPGDSVWYVDKEELTVKKARVKRLGEMYGYGSLRIETDIIPFTTHLNSTQSTSYTFYTGEEQAWKYMLGWKKSRMCTVGKEMEKLMKELERYEEIWRPEERR